MAFVCGELRLKSRLLAGAKAAIAAGAIVLTFCFYVRQTPDPFVNFRAFYCAGQAELAGVDPYREHPLRECERTLTSPRLRAVPVATMPAPFPGFVMAVFAGIAMVPFSIAVMIWSVASLGALSLSVLLVARATRVSVLASAIVLGFPAAVVALPPGQLTPFALLSLAGAATLLQLDRPRWAALVSLGALLEPHVGLALWLGIFVGIPKSRIVLAVGATTLELVGLLVSGPLREWEYLRAVLPAHALANLSDASQFSAANFAFAAGAPAKAALALGSVWYVCSLLAGVCIALRLRRRLGAAAIAYIPVAFAVFGGTHTHLQQLALALPAFLLLGSTATVKSRDFYGIAIYIAAVPWLPLAALPQLFFVPSALAVLLAGELLNKRPALWLGLGCYGLLTLTELAILAWPTPHMIPSAQIRGNPLAEVSWQLFTLARNVPADKWRFIAKAPTVIAFLVLLSFCVKGAVTRSRAVPQC